MAAFFARNGFRNIVASGLAMTGLAACAAPAALSPVASSPSAAPKLEAALPNLPKRPLLSVAQLVSLKDVSRRDLVSKLGEPDFTRRDPPAEMWQYRSASCVLDVFLYPDGADLKVAFATTRDRAQLKAPQNQCTPFGPAQTASAG